MGERDDVLEPDPTRPEHIVRTGRIQDVEDGLSEMPHVILNQARVHDMYLDVMRNAPSRLAPDYQRRLIDLAVHETAANHPVTVRLERLDSDHKVETETVAARYVVGCDGARSAVRKAIGRETQGRSGQQGLGRDGCPGGNGFPGYPAENLDSVRQRLNAADYSARGRLRESGRLREKWHQHLEGQQRLFRARAVT